MNRPLGFSVTIFFPSGQLEGLRIIEKSNWKGRGLIFSRSVFADEVRHREELNLTGVYVLWGPSGIEQLPRVYIGEGNVLLQRLDSHVRDKDFWTYGVVFTSDQSLNKAHVQYLEAKLVQLANEAKRCKLDNTNIPQKPSLSDTDMGTAEQYLTDMLLCLLIIGVNFFDKLQKPTKTNQNLFLSGKNIKAHGFEDTAGFVVCTGSQAVKKEVRSIQTHLADLRKVLLNQGIFEDKDDVYQFVQDYIFPSPSTAASVLLGSSRNGLTTWKDINGRSLKKIQEAEEETIDESDVE